MWLDGGRVSVGPGGLVVRLIEALVWLGLLVMGFSLGKVESNLSDDLRVELGEHVTCTGNCAAGLCGWPEELDALLLSA